jgi:hypothetical protein
VVIQPPRVTLPPCACTHSGRNVAKPAETAERQTTAK